MNRIVKYFCFSVFLLIWCSCAIQVPPAGGDQDIIAPKVVNSKPVNYSTGFKGNEIAISFDEFIQLKDVQSSLVISPPLKKFPDVKVRKKTLYIQFEDTLEANTTYTFNFANSILDLNEGNALENYQFVISTGDVLDSLELSGMIKEAFNNKPKKDVLVMLYKANEDSLPFLKRPYYFAKSNAEGLYHIRNISPGMYKIIGLEDLNKDYLYNPPEESIASLDSMVKAGSTDVDLRLSRELEEFKLLRSYSEEPGKAVCVFNGVSDTLSFTWLSDTIALELYSANYSEKKDTLNIYYKNLLADTIQLLFPELNVKDTITIRLLKKDSRSSGRNKQVLSVEARSSAGNFQDLNKPFELIFNHPIETAVPENIKLLEDSTEVSSESFQFTNELKTKLRYNGVWKPGLVYDLFIPSGTFKDIYGLENDTIISKFRTRQETDYASITTVINSKSGKFPLIIQLVNDQEQVFEESILSGDSTVVFSFLSPGMYRLKVIEDSNSNMKWDSGSYLNKIQPELVHYYPEAIQMRSNWDVEIKWQLD
jgi:hypothetical protein